MKTGWKVFWIVCAGAIAIGFVCCAVAFGLGVTLDAIHGRFPNGFGYVGGSGKEAEDIHESFKGITEIDAEIAAGEVSVYATDEDEIRVETKNLRQRLGFKCYVEGNELKLKTNKRLYHLNNMGKGTIKVYIPREMRFDEVSFDMGAGTLTMDEVYADSFSVDVGAGEVEVADFQAREGSLKCGAGTIRAKGDVTSELEIECGVGEVEFTAYGHETDYNYDIDCAVGEVVCGGSDYSGIGGHRHIDNGADKDMEISTGVGSVTVEFDGTKVR